MLTLSRIEFYRSCPTLGGKMIGVILWSDAADQKAVIWCEDQGELAFLSDAENASMPDPFFDVGDVVEFDIRTDRSTRLAKNTHRIQQNWGSTLSDGLSAMASVRPSMGEPANSAEIIPFRIDPATRTLPNSTPRQKRRV